MNSDMTDTRRLFRNRFGCYFDNDDSRGVGVHDGSPLTLLDLCKFLAEDPEPFPRNYDTDMRKLCGHEFMYWLREERTYGDVARLLTRRLAGEDGRMQPIGGRWVHAVLSKSDRSRVVEM